MSLDGLGNLDGLGKQTLPALLTTHSTKMTRGRFDDVVAAMNPANEAVEVDRDVTRENALTSCPEDLANSTLRCVAKSVELLNHFDQTTWCHGPLCWFSVAGS